MWYRASSVIAAIRQCDRLSFAGDFPVPACPKAGNNIHCHSDFPDCEGKNFKCPQSLRITNERGDPSILYFEYYVSPDDRDGRIKKQNSTLLMLIRKYMIDETIMVSVG
jgi:hypothetical protein